MERKNPYWALYLLFGGGMLLSLAMGVYAYQKADLRAYRQIGFFICLMLVGLLQVRHMQRWNGAEQFLKRISPVLEKRFLSQPQIKKLCLQAADLIQNGGQENLSKALGILAKAEQKAWYREDKGAVIFLQGWVKDNLGQKRESISSLRASVKLDESNYAAWNMLGLLLVQEIGRSGYEEAKGCYQKAVELGYLGRAESNLGMLYMRQGDLVHARQWMEMALAHEEIPETAAAMAVLEARQGDSTRAWRYYEDAQRLKYKSLTELHRQVTEALSVRRSTWETGAGCSEEELMALNKEIVRSVR